MAATRRLRLHPDGSRMARRSFLGGMAGAAIATHASRVAASDLAQHWRAWKARFLAKDGRVVDVPQGGITHSEGQGYGALLAQAAGDEPAFRLIEGWTTRNLQLRRDRMMGWKWVPQGKGGQLADGHNASDADLFRAWALLRATRDSRWSGVEELAEGIAADLANLCLWPDPRAPREYLLLPGAESRRTNGRVLLNPSYFMPRALHELGEAFGDLRLIRAADHASTVLTELTELGFLPDWIDRTRTGFAQPRDHDLRWGYDAIRIPLYLVWSGQSAHPAVALAAALMDRSEVPDHVAVSITPDHAVQAVSNSAGFLAIRSLNHCTTAVRHPAKDDQNAYYPQTLRLLAELALREGGCTRR